MISKAPVDHENTYLLPKCAFLIYTHTSDLQLISELK